MSSSLLNGQAESHLVLPVKVTHKKQPYPGCSAQGSLPRVHSEQVLSKKVVEYVYRRTDFVWSHLKSHDFLGCWKGIQCSIFSQFSCHPCTPRVQLACTQPYWCVHCSPRQCIQSLQRWSICPLLLRWLSLDTGDSFTFLKKMKCFTMGNFCFLSRSLNFWRMFLCQTHFYGHMLIFLGRVIGSD